ncbi:unnamed protein product [Rotaria magnacalcarata]|nr:unnamed protein product [Rotaria magnacalcarata]
MGINSEVSSVLVEPRFGLDVSLVTRVYFTIIPNEIISQEQLQLSIRRTDAHQFTTNVSSPINDGTRHDIENYLTSFNSRIFVFKALIQLIDSLSLVTEYGQAKIVYAESVNAQQTRCLFGSSLIYNLNRLWANENVNYAKNISTQLQNQKTRPGKESRYHRNDEEDRTHHGQLLSKFDELNQEPIIDDYDDDELNKGRLNSEYFLRDFKSSNDQRKLQTKQKWIDHMIESTKLDEYERQHESDKRFIFDVTPTLDKQWNALSTAMGVKEKISKYVKETADAYNKLVD